MTPAARSMQIFGLYMLFEGLILVTVPQLLLSLLALPQTSDVWVRVAGIALMVLAYYYLMTARTNLQAFFPLTVPTRIFQFVMFLVFVTLGLVKWTVLMPAAVEMASGVWTAWTLRRPPV